MLLKQICTVNSSLRKSLVAKHLGRWCPDALFQFENKVTINLYSAFKIFLGFVVVRLGAIIFYNLSKVTINSDSAFKILCDLVGSFKYYVTPMGHSNIV